MFQDNLKKYIRHIYPCICSMLSLTTALISSSSAYLPAAAVAPTRAAHTVRQSAVFMDETLMEKALAGELEEPDPLSSPTPHPAS